MKFSLKQVQISLNVQLAERWTVDHFTSPIPKMLGGKVGRKFVQKWDVIKWILDLLLLKTELLVDSGKEKFDHSFKIE